MISSNKYFSTDFDYSEYLNGDTVRRLLDNLPPISALEEDSGSSSGHSLHWRSFYNSHSKGLVYKPRKYLYSEFKPFFDSAFLDGDRETAVTVLEVGCGYGCSVVPLARLLHENGIKDVFLIASDYCEESLSILRGADHYEEYGAYLRTLRWDATAPFDTDLLPVPCPRPSLVLCVFTLSAVSPDNHLAVLRNVAALLLPGGCLLLRDYAFADLTMFRHKSRVGKMLFLRGQEKTLAYYFTPEYLESLVDALQGLLVVEEMQVCTVRLRNRAGSKDSADMPRCFVHCVLRKGK